MPKPVLYQCCDHCLVKFGECPDKAENGGHYEICPEPDCRKGSTFVARKT